MNKPLIYLAGPYTHKTKSMMREREKRHVLCAGNLLKRGFLVYSPIAETASIAKFCNMINTDWDTWRDKDLKQLERCDEMWIILIDGWKESRGVRGEIKFCLRKNIPIRLIDVSNDSIRKIQKKQLMTILGVTNVKELND